MSKPLLLDGCQMADHEGNRYEVFNPRWWRVDRWVRFWLSRKPRGRVSITIAHEDGIATLDVRILKEKPTRPRAIPKFLF